MQRRMHAVRSCTLNHRERVFFSLNHPHSFLRQWCCQWLSFYRIKRQRGTTQVLDLKHKIAADPRICKTMHHILVRLLHLFCVVCPRSTIFSHLRPAHITTAEDESLFFQFHSDTHMVTANNFSQKMCKHNWENGKLLLIHSQSENWNWRMWVTVGRWWIPWVLYAYLHVHVSVLCACLCMCVYTMNDSERCCNTPGKMFTLVDTGVIKVYESFIGYEKHSSSQGH